MSELAHNPDNHEKKHVPLTDNCNTCDQDYEITPSNAFLFNFEGQKELNYMYCICTHCSSKWRIFIGEQTFEAAINNGFEPINDDKYAPQDLYEKWCDLNGIVLPETYELTNRHEGLVRKFGETLLNMPPEIFWDNIEAETGRPYPEKWI